MIRMNVNKKIRNEHILIKMFINNQYNYKFQSKTILLCTQKKKKKAICNVQIYYYSSGYVHL